MGPHPCFPESLASIFRLNLSPQSLASISRLNLSTGLSRLIRCGPTAQFAGPPIGCLFCIRANCRGSALRYTPVLCRTRRWSERSARRKTPARHPARLGDCSEIRRRGRFRHQNAATSQVLALPEFSGPRCQQSPVHRTYLSTAEASARDLRSWFSAETRSLGPAPQVALPRRRPN
jgi:hypothetical protein